MHTLELADADVTAQAEKRANLASPVIMIDH